MVAERKYVLTKIAAGDYLLPSNDAKTLWRITEYAEDGSAEWQDEAGKWHKVTGTFWSTAKYERPFNDLGEHADPDFLDWSNWLHWESGFRTRTEAIKAALR